MDPENADETDDAAAEKRLVSFLFGCLFFYCVLIVFSSLYLNLVLQIDLSRVAQIIPITLILSYILLALLFYTWRPFGLV